MAGFMFLKDVKTDDAFDVLMSFIMISVMVTLFIFFLRQSILLFYSRYKDYRLSKLPKVDLALRADLGLG